MEAPCVPVPPPQGRSRAGAADARFPRLHTTTTRGRHPELGLSPSEPPAPSGRPGCPDWTRPHTSTARRLPDALISAGVITSACGDGVGQLTVWRLSDCRLPGDFGFDPLGLGEEPEALKWYVQAELVHCRFAMAGVAGILFTDVSLPIHVPLLFLRPANHGL